MVTKDQITTHAGLFNQLTSIKQADLLLNPLVMEPKHPIGFPHGRPLKEVWEKEF